MKKQIDPFVARFQKLAGIKPSLEEFDYGKNLFADPTTKYQDGSEVDFKLKDFISGDTEIPNTEEEELILNAIVQMNGGAYENAKPIASYAKDLFTLKSKFPLILDPRKSKFAGDLFYRGASLSKDIFSKYIDRMIPSPDIKGEYVVNNANLLITPESMIIGDRGIHSFTPSFEIAYNFRPYSRDINSNKIPVIIGVDSNNPNFIFNPDFLDSIVPFPESEFFFIGDKIPVEKIYVNEKVVKTLK